MLTFIQFIESANVSKKLLKNPPSGVSDMNKQNTGYKARLTWIRNEPKPVNDWWNREKKEKTRGLQAFKSSNKPKTKKSSDDDVHAVQRYVELGQAIRKKGK